MISPIFGSLHLFVTAYVESDLFGKIIFLSLIVLSIVAWIILISKMYVTRKIDAIGKRFHAAVLHAKEPLLSLSLEMLPFGGSKEILNPFARVFASLKQKTVEVLNKNLFFSEKETPTVYLSPADLELLETYAITTISAEMKFLEKNLFILTTVVSLAPFLGLLGTVWGILVTFGELNKGGSLGTNTMILGGLSTALVTTVLGLLIAIPSLIGHNYLKTKVRSISNEMQDFLYELLTIIELQYRKVSAP